MAFEQAYAQRGLEIGDGLRHDRLGNGEIVRGFRHAPALGHSQQDVKLTQFQTAADAVYQLHRILP